MTNEEKINILNKTFCSDIKLSNRHEYIGTIPNHGNIIVDFADDYTLISMANPGTKFGQYILDILIKSKNVLILNVVLIDSGFGFLYLFLVSFINELNNITI